MQTARAQVIMLIRDRQITGRGMGHIPVILIACDDNKKILGVKCPYHQEFIDDLKRIIPSWLRGWHPAESIWLVDPGYYNYITNLFAKYFSHLRGWASINTDGCYLLSPPAITKEKRFVPPSSTLNRTLNRELISAVNAVSEIVTEDLLETMNNPIGIEHIVEVIIDEWKAGRISDIEALKAIESLVK
jgi:hypothetical protein